MSIENFLAGERNFLNSADLDPANAVAVALYDSAMVLKQNGQLLEAAAMLEPSVRRRGAPKAQYQELFKIWRSFNKVDLQNARFELVLARVRDMVRLDQEMIDDYLNYGSVQQRRNLPTDYFDGYRNLLVTDAKAFRKAAEQLGDRAGVAEASEVLLAIEERKARAKGGPHK